ncbi:MAG: hypothetical protein ACYCWW_08460 [Deltaproteobacteria bacterium]
MKPNHDRCVIHPLDDVPEAKRSADGLGPIKLSRATKAALSALRVYLVAVATLLGYRLLGLAHAFK